MRLLVIGCGQCGGRIANEFARLNRRARSQRSIDIITGAFAVNTDAADLSGLSSIKPDYQHRILIGRQKTGGHGVGKINELGAEIAKEDVDMLLEGVKTTRAFHETDAFLLCASAAGGTGSGSIPIFTRYLKELYSEKPVYNLIVLPFKNEEQVEQRTVYNTATCLKSVYMVADAIFMVDNQRYLRKDCAIQDNLNIINNRVVEPFFNLLSAGEETKSKHIGAKVLDAGDIIQTLMGWTAIGYSKIQIPLFNFPFGRSSDFRKKGSEAHRGIQAMESAINDVSVKFRASDAKRALYLISGSPEEMNMTLMNEIGNSLKRVATDAIIRSGDYPRASRSIEITVVLSEIFSVSRVMEYFSKAIQYISSQRKSHGFEYEPTQMGEAFKDLPSLL